MNATDKEALRMLSEPSAKLARILLTSMTRIWLAIDLSEVAEVRRSTVYDTVDHWEEMGILVDAPAPPGTLPNIAAHGRFFALSDEGEDLLRELLEEFNAEEMAKKHRNRARELRAALRAKRPKPVAKSRRGRRPAVSGR